MRAWILIPAVSLALYLLLSGSGKVETQTGNLIFPHKLHVEDVGAECATCHSGVETSKSGRDRFLPGMDACAQCHDVEDEKGCIMCHSDPNNIILSPVAGMGYEDFSHDIHASKMKCETCHASQSGKSESASLFPNMAACVDCHKTSQVNTSCNQCHSAGMPAKPSDHQVMWMKSHGEEAVAAGNDCAMCHQAPGATVTCAQCHQGGAFGSPHPRNFTHSTAFIRGGGFADCQSCHEAESFCASCHMTKMVLPSDHSRPGWAVKNSGGSHARKGSVDLESCVICHSSMTSQQTCFSAGCHQ